jgi:hypothetical protein
MDATAKTQKRTHYTQKFNNGPQEIVEEGAVTLQEAEKLVKDFYSAPFVNGSVFLMGFSKPEDDSQMIEFTKNDSGAIELIRVNPTKTGNELFEEAKTSIDDALMYLNENW